MKFFSFSVVPQLPPKAEKSTSSLLSTPLRCSSLFFPFIIVKSISSPPPLGVLIFFSLSFRIRPPTRPRLLFVDHAFFCPFPQKNDGNSPSPKPSAPTKHLRSFVKISPPSKDKESISMPALALNQFYTFPFQMKVFLAPFFPKRKRKFSSFQPYFLCSR